MMQRPLQSNLQRKRNLWSTISGWSGGCNKESHEFVYPKDASIESSGCMLLISQLPLREGVEIPLYT
jgi:hypothetical protein